MMQTCAKLVGGDWNMNGYEWIMFPETVGNVHHPNWLSLHFSEGWLNHQPETIMAMSLNKMIDADAELGLFCSDSGLLRGRNFVDVLIVKIHTPFQDECCNPAI